MMDPNDFLERTAQADIGLFTGVPCSLFTSLIDTVIASPEIDYIGAANEGDAVAIAAGAELGGKRGAVLFQNSGLGNAVNPFTSLTETFRIPCLVICSWRGQPDGPEDEPQHDRMGKITPGLFDLMGIPWALCPSNVQDLVPVLDRAKEHMDRERLPFALVVPKGTFEKGAERTSAAVRPVTARSEPLPASWAPLPVDRVLAAVQGAVGPDDVILTTTGFTGRALYAVGDRPSQLYMVGSMGCVSSLGLGLARAQPNRRVVVLDGDGALLIRMGALATIGYERPKNLLHVLLDNGVHDSTGAQATVSASIDAAGIAASCGYPQVERVMSLDDVGRAVGEARDELTFLHVRTEPRADRKLPRPTIRPHEVAERLRNFLR